MKTLYLLRHAKAEPGTKDVKDPDRGLSSRGREACVAMGAYMKAKSYIPARVMVSPSVRTRQTVSALADAMNTTFYQDFEQSLYLAGMEEILALVQGADDAADSLMIVGHNPGMHHAALLLAESRPCKLRKNLELKYPTCALAVLRFEAGRWRDLAAGKGKLTDFVLAAEL